MQQYLTSIDEFDVTARQNGFAGQVLFLQQQSWSTDNYVILVLNKCKKKTKIAQLRLILGSTKREHLVWALMY